MGQIMVVNPGININSERVNMNRHNGFTLIELMVTVAIIGILAGLAYPSYMESVKRSNRAEAKADLTDVAQRLQRCYTLYGKFDDASCGVFASLNGAPRMQTRGKHLYEITLDAVPAGFTTANSFKLVATAIAAPQTQDSNSAQDCTVLRLDQRGDKTPAACW